MTTKKHLLFGSYITTFVGLSAYYFGVNDRVALVLITATLLLLYPVILVGQMTIRNAAKTNFTEESWVYHWLNKEKTMLQRVLSFVLATILSVSFLIIAKGIVIEHGFLASLLIVFFVTAIASALIQSPRAASIQSGTVREEVTDVSFLGLFIAVFFVNLVLALVLSAAETHKFLGSDVNLGNFIRYASERAIPPLETNEFSRILINVYLVMDAFKLGVVNELLSAFSIHKEHFYGFYALVFILNLLKLFAFSLPLVFAQRSLIVASDRLEGPILSLSRWIWRRVSDSLGAGRGLGEKLAQRLSRVWRLRGKNIPE